MDFYRARKDDFKYVKYKKSLIHNTATIASEGQNIIGVLEYEIKNMEEAEIINFNIFESCREDLIFKGLIDEIDYWNPYLKRIIYNEDNNIINSNVLINAGFIKSSTWILSMNNNIKVFKIDIEEITPGQLIVDETKVNRVNSWIKIPEDIVITCVKIEDKIVCIDGYSRLIAAYNKGFKYVFAYLETNDDNIQFYRTCMKWCEEQKIFKIKDLANRTVTPEEHEKLWINRCQAYLNEHK
ncbi:hypothetical protein KQI42_14370 [Tissierella sp. MSJ-40]|uniref:Uncharacterized protein n=1 Tax=Tissierella simiarum TaxID=2841534 RepID=A0ABS6E8X3_9FIRM|nr:hypothetical protein [Tissierella simiarum]MBU5439204.1 hypothetical protein [Tissierella simiarum]